ncbi:MAG TPA: P-loop NTPase [Acidimicrobiia bacterium]|nr:P-loop NTPase [Acidimicrobiia bacterium]
MALEQPGAPGVQWNGPSAGPYDVAIVEPDSRWRLRIGATLTAAAQFEALESLLPALRPGRPTVVVFGPGLANPYGFEQIHRLVSLRPELGALFAVDGDVTTPLLHSTLRAGARDTVTVNDAPALAEAVSRVGTLLGSGVNRTPVPVDHRAAPGKLVVVFSAKGGVGKSTTAINVAVAMAHRSDERIALVDADLNFGDVAVLLGIPPQQTVLDAVSATQYGDTDLVRSMLAVHSPSGLLVLPAPTEPVLDTVIDPAEIVSVCQTLQAACGFVVADLAPLLDDLTVALIEAADVVLLIGGMDIPSVKNLKIGIQALDLHAIAGPKLRLVLNRANTQVKLDVREVESVLGLRAEFPVPSDISVPIAVNAGVPVVELAPDAPASRAFDRIARMLLGGEAALGKGRRWTRKAARA